MLKAVFVHLGTAPAEHLWLNLKRHLKLFPDIQVNLILNDENLSERAAGLGVPVTFYQANAYQNELLNSLTHGTDFRQGFWRFTLERLFALETFHTLNPHDSILHIESDVLLMPNFPFAGLLSTNLMAWTNYNSERDVSAILFSPRANETSWLVREIEKLLETNKSLTDMTALSTIRTSNPHRIEQLPGLKEAIDAGLAACFDSAVMGMWLCGEDPRNNYGVLKLHNNDEFLRSSTNFDPSALIYRYSKELGFYVEVTSKQIILNCLHVHSKDLKIFDDEWEARLMKFLELSRNSKPTKRFLPRVLFQLLKDNFSQRTFIPFLLGIPPIYKIRMHARQKLLR